MCGCVCVCVCVCVGGGGRETGICEDNIKYRDFKKSEEYC